MGKFFGRGRVLSLELVSGILAAGDERCVDTLSDDAYLAATGDRMPNPSGQDVQVWAFDGLLGIHFA